jgi:hypothetical protein
MLDDRQFCGTGQKLGYRRPISVCQKVTRGACAHKAIAFEQGYLGAKSGEENDVE